MAEKKLPGSWAKVFENELEPISVQEYQAGCLGRLLTLNVSMMQSLLHLEGMLGAQDQYNALVAKAMGMPYADSEEVREALAMYRAAKYNETRKALATNTGENDA